METVGGSPIGGKQRSEDVPHTTLAQPLAEHLERGLHRL
jgi:hypothetical protein